MGKRIIIFASGTGTNAQNMITHFQSKDIAKVVHVLSNKKDAKVLTLAKNLNVATSVFTKETLIEGTAILKILEKEQPDLIVLAGFLLKFPLSILKKYPNKVINIHPSLLPNYGGKGMYGAHVHKAVIENKEKESGITIHFVNEHYDEGAIIFQKNVKITKKETPETLAKKIHVLEQKWLPKVIEKLLTNATKPNSV